MATIRQQIASEEKYKKLYSRHEKKLARLKKLEDSYGDLKVKEALFGGKFESLLTEQKMLACKIIELEAYWGKLVTDHEKMKAEYVIKKDTYLKIKADYEALKADYLHERQILVMSYEAQSEMQNKIANAQNELGKLQDSLLYMLDNQVAMGKELEKARKDTNKMTKQREVLSNNITKTAIKQQRTKDKLYAIKYSIFNVQKELSKLDDKLAEYKI